MSVVVYKHFNIYSFLSHMLLISYLESYLQNALLTLLHMNSVVILSWYLSNYLKAFNNSKKG